ncbi:aldo/keto reductase family protein [Nitzschia inconspicua]|uniref:Aldo/keto reductase family protein n=1 Tax=Nitzschia inconspicua TaxID=303405 RepID=A0A9K3KVW5_9STRA|nr:aldo/keto reductase family protein [Nitzschia inconspicua]
MKSFSSSSSSSSSLSTFTTSSTLFSMATTTTTTILGKMLCWSLSSLLLLLLLKGGNNNNNNNGGGGRVWLALNIEYGIYNHNIIYAIYRTPILLAATALSSSSFSSKTSSSKAGAATTNNNNNKYSVGNVKVPMLRNGMDYVRLGDSDLIVSKVCMGTMTYGEQNTIEEGVALLRRAFDDYGINFLDTAEIYPVPTKPTTQGQTDYTVREFLKNRNRNDVVIATKVAGRSPRMTWLPRAQPNTPADLTKEQILQSVDASLERLGCQYIDLLQIHWPGRYCGGSFGSPDFKPSQYEQDIKDNNNNLPPVPFQEQLEAMQQLIREGKVRYIGVSNETPFGVCTMVELHNRYPDLYPKIVSIQNSYSLVVRKDYEAGLAETCYHHNVALLPYSPLAGGALTGKYRTEETSKNARMNLFPGFMERYLQSINEEAVNCYCGLAHKYNLTPTQLALSWCYHNELCASTIVGATTMEQLEENLQAYDIKLDDVNTKIREEIDAIYKKYTDPTKARNNPQ